MTNTANSGQLGKFTTTRRVEFCDTDMAGIVHFSTFYKWMEQAEHDYFRSLGLSIVTHTPVLCHHRLTLLALLTRLRF